MFSKTKKAKFNFWGLDNPEKLKEAPTDPPISKQLADIVNPVNLLDQIFGTKSPEAGKTSEKKPNVKGNEVVIFSNKVDKENRQLQEETAQVLSELKRQVASLEKSEKALTKEISKVKVDQLPPKAGIYYLRFFEWLINVVKGLRVKIEEGRNWLATFNGRKSKKMGYWQKYKKHGTTFGLSHERSLATQTG